MRGAIGIMSSGSYALPVPAENFPKRTHLPALGGVFCSWSVRSLTHPNRRWPLDLKNEAKQAQLKNRDDGCQSLHHNQRV